MKKKKVTKKQIGVFAVSVLMMTLLGSVARVQGSTADIKDRDQLGPFVHYNGIIFDVLETYSADAEGAVAVGGKSKLGTGWGQFDFGATAHGQYDHVAMGNYQNPNGYPTVLLNDLPEITSQWHTVSAYGGPVVLNETLKTAYIGGNMINGTTKYAKADIVEDFFKDAYSETGRVGALFLNANTKADATVKFDDVNKDWASFNAKEYYNNGDYTVYQPDNITDYGSTGMTSEKIAVINMDAGARVEIRGVQIPKDMGDNFDLIIFNFPAVSDVTFTSNSLMMDGTGFLTSDPRNKTVDKYAGKIIWNFPVAETIQTKQCGIVGSVLAPDADVNANGGSINGMLVSNSLKTMNGFELHAFYMKKNIYEFGRDDVTGSVELMKKDDDDGFLEGAVFELYKSDDTLVGTYMTDRYGVITVDNLAKGSYYFKEVKAPDGYEIKGDGKYAFAISKGNTYIELEAINTEKKTDLTLKKTDEADLTEMLQGAKFALYRSHKTTSGKLSMELVQSGLETGADGKLHIEDLTVSYYYLVEYQAPDGYTLDKYNVYQFLVELDDNGDPGVNEDKFFKLNADLGGVDLNDPGEIEHDDSVAKEKVDYDQTDSSYVIKNEKADKPKGGFSLIKKDKESGETLAGVVFRLRQYDGSEYNIDMGDYITDVFGRIDVDDLEPGKYLLTEKEALDGYKDNQTEYKFEILINGSNAEYPDVIAVENERIKGDVELTKTDSRTTDTLEGAKFMLFRSTYAEDGTLNLTQVDSGTSDDLFESGSDGKVKLTNLYAGYYYLVETEAPDGYKIPVGVAYQIILTANEGTLDQKINKLIFDDPNKLDVSDLSGITNSTEGITVEELPAAEIENEEIVLGRVTIQKTDEDTKQPLKGAEFTLKSLNGDAKTYLLTTNELGYAAVGNLPMGNYSLEETKVPAGYKDDPGSVKITYMDEKHEKREYEPGTAFVLEEENSAFSFLITNKQLDTAVSFTKTDADDQSHLSDAEFILYKSQRKDTGELYLERDETNGSIVSDSNGTVTVTGLQKGYYYLVETKAPDGYVLPTARVIQIEVMFNGTSMETRTYLLELKDGAAIADLESMDAINKTPLKDNQIPNDRVPADPKGEIILTKEDEESGTLLGGARFELHKEVGGQYSKVAEATTNELGQIRFTELEPGRYRLIEAEVPTGYVPDSVKYYIGDQKVEMDEGIQIGTGTGAEMICSITATNKAAALAAPVSMTLSKIDGLTKKPLDGAEFLVYESLGIKALPGNADDEDSVVLLFKDIVISDADGTITVEGVAEKYYYIAEVEAPVSYAPVVEVIQADVQNIEGQEVVEKEIFSLEVDPRDITLEDITKIESGEWNKTPISSSEIENYQIVGSIALWKYIEGTQELLPGAEFRLYQKTGDGEHDWTEAGVYRTNASGYLHIPGLELGTYKLEETDWSGGYYQSIDIVNGGQIELTLENPDAVVRVDNKKPLLEEKLTFKKAVEGSDSLNGVMFHLYRCSQRENGSLLDFTLMKEYTEADFSDRTITFPDLPEGSYYLVETRSPEGYWMEHTYKVFQVKITWNAETRKLESAVKEVMILDPDAYDLDNPTGIVNDHDLELIDVEKDGDAYVIVNEKEPDFFGRATLIKVDEDGDTPLAGAKFRLSRLLDEEKDEWMILGVQSTDVFGKIAIERLKEGTYKVEEVAAPFGYEVLMAEPLIFTIARDFDEAELNGPEIYLEVENKEIKGSITVEKHSYEGDETGDEEVLEDVEFSLYYWQYEPALMQAVPLSAAGDDADHGISDTMFAAVPHLVAAKKTTLDTPVVFEDLTQGWYTLVETGKPDGYDASYTRFYTADGRAMNDSGDEVSFEITGTGEQYEYEFTAKNTRLKGDVKIIKVDADSLETDEEHQVPDIETLAGVKFDLYQILAGREEKLINKGLVTDGEGRLVIENLQVGRYILYEIENPNEGYEVDESNYVLFSIRANEESTAVVDTGDVLFTNKKLETGISLRVLKIREDREDEVLEGAVFYLYRTEEIDGEKVETLIQHGICTREDGTAVINDITEGDYILREMQAPTGFETEEGSKRDLLFSVVWKEGQFKVESEAAEFAYDEHGDAWMTVGNTYIDHLPDVSLVKRDKHTEEVLQGAKFDVYYAGTELEEESRENTGHYNLYATVKSDSTGELVFPHMQEGYYYMVEVEAPEGYVIATDTGSGSGLYFFYITYEEGKLVMDLNNRIYREGEDNDEIRIYNQKEGYVEPEPEKPEPEKPEPEKPEPEGPKPEPEGPKSETDKGTKSVNGGTTPKTGDFSNAVYLWSLLGTAALLISLAAIRKCNQAAGDK